MSMFWGSIGNADATSTNNLGYDELIKLIEDNKEQIRNLEVKVEELHIQNVCIESKNEYMNVSQRKLAKKEKKIFDNSYTLQEDTYSMMMTSRIFSLQWWFGLLVFIFQTLILVLVLFDQIMVGVMFNTFMIPVAVHPAVVIAQWFSLVIAMLTQDDLLSSITTLLELWDEEKWMQVVKNEKDNNNSSRIWYTRICLPNACKFIQGLLSLVNCFIIIIQSSSTIDLFKDFLALLFISQLDNIIYNLAKEGHLGQSLLKQAKQTKAIIIPRNSIIDDTSCTMFGVQFRIKAIMFLFLFTFINAVWAYFVFLQLSGYLFKQEFPNCSVPYFWEIGDGYCRGGVHYNTPECDYEGGDCYDFNKLYPNCTVLFPTFFIGTGKCDGGEYNITECGYDGGDCI